MKAAKSRHASSIRPQLQIPFVLIDHSGGRCPALLVLITRRVYFRPIPLKNSVEAII